MINELLNEESKGLTNAKVMTIPLEDIQPNPLNRAPIVNVEDLATLIKEDGLTTPLIVYKQANHDYVLISGERRYTALQSIGYEAIPVIVIPRPETELKERMLILDANAQREETEDYKTLRAVEYAELYVILKKEGKLAAGILKRDWVGTHMNISGRQVQRYLAEKEETAQGNQHGHDVHVKEKVVNASKEIKKMVKQVESLQQMELDEFTKDGAKLSNCEQLAYIRDSIKVLLEELRNGKE